VIDAYVLNKVVPLVDGDAVWKQYTPEMHASSEPLLPVAGHTVYVGLDFGRRPAAVFGQLINNRWLIQYEAIGKDMSSARFAPIVQRMLQTKYPGFNVMMYGDPKGRDRGQQTETTSYDVFRAHKMLVMPAPIKKNHIQTRIDVVDYLLTQSDYGHSRILISPECRVLKSAMQGGYRFPPTKPGVGEEREPVKDRFSDVADALQYLVLGGGEGRTMLGLGGPGGTIPQPVQTRTPRSRRRFAA
jgi:hypothetical protein